MWYSIRFRPVWALNEEKSVRLALSETKLETFRASTRQIVLSWSKQLYRLLWAGCIQRKNEFNEYCCPLEWLDSIQKIKATAKLEAGFFLFQWFNQSWQNGNRPDYLGLDRVSDEYCYRVYINFLSFRNHYGVFKTARATYCKSNIGYTTVFDAGLYALFDRR